MKPKVLITYEIPRVAYDFLKGKYAVTWNKSKLSESDLVRRVGPFQGLLTTLADPITPAVLRAGKRLRVVANFAVGFNNIDLEAARSLGVTVTNTPEVLTDATADLTWALLLACARRLPEGERLVRAGKFKGTHPLMLLGLDLRGKTLGVFGCGRIGQAVALRSRGWDMKVLYHNRHRLPPAAEKRLGARRVSFQALLEKSDFLVVTSPLTPQTKGRFAYREFSKMKPTSVFINTGRGPIHVEKDLLRALREGRIFYAGLDVYEREPALEPGLRQSDRVVLLPHIGSATVQTRNTMALLAARNLDLVLRGQKALTPVT